MRLAVVLALSFTLALGVIWAIVVGQRPYRHRSVSPDALEAFVNILMLRGDDGALLFAELQGRAGFVQLAKYIEPQGPRLVFGFPRAPWSASVFESVKAALDALDTDYQLQETGRSDTTHFLIADAGADVSLAARILRTALVDGIGLRLDERVDVLICQPGMQRSSIPAHRVGHE